jgi:hypothetical protein
LYGDLVLNGIITLEVDPAEIKQTSEKTLPLNPDSVTPASYASTVEVIAPEEMPPVTIRSVAAFAEQIRFPLEAVVALPGLLVKAAGHLCAEEKAEDRLRVWLDAYQVRGSFDDRTLVALYREVVK